MVAGRLNLLIINQSLPTLNLKFCTCLRYNTKLSLCARSFHRNPRDSLLKLPERVIFRRMHQDDDANARNACQVIDALLAEGPIDERLANAKWCLHVFELCKPENSAEILKELWDIVYHITEWAKDRTARDLTSEQETYIAARLLDLYVEISGGALIF